MPQVYSKSARSAHAGLTAWDPPAKQTPLGQSWRRAPPNFVIVVEPAWRRTFQAKRPPKHNRAAHPPRELHRSTRGSEQMAETQSEGSSNSGGRRRRGGGGGGGNREEKVAPTVDPDVEVMNLAELKRASMEELYDKATDLGLEINGTLRKQDICFEMLKHQAEQNGGRGRPRVVPRGLRLSARPRLQLRARPRRHLRLPQPDPATACARATRWPARSARPRRRSATTASSRSRPSTACLPMSTESASLRQPDAAVPRGALQARNDPEELQHAHHRSDVPHRQGPARAHRLAPARRQDRPLQDVANAITKTTPRSPSSCCSSTSARRRSPTCSARSRARSSARPSTSPPSGTCRSPRW
jgi:hypothetical protein